MRIKELRYWVQKVLPLVYDDSLSYMELLNKVVAKLNEVIELANGIDATIAEEVNGIMNEWIEDGTFEDIINQTVLADLNDRITEAEGDIDSLDSRVDTLEERPTSIVTPQSVGYPSTKTADEAFEILEGYSATQIAIPSGDYNLTRTYNLQNVIIDDGNYTNFAPIHKRKKYLDLQGFSMNKNVQLPAVKSYVEAVCYLNGNYYAAVYNWDSDDTDWLIKYDANFNQLLQGNMNRPETDAYSAHAPNNIYTDGTYIYVDNIRVVSKYDASTLSLVQRWTIPNILETYYFNGSFWGWNFSGTALLIYELNNDFTIKDTHTVDRGVTATMQSWTIHNGLIYFITTTGYYTIVDMSDWSFVNVSYENQVEIENIFFVNNKPFFAGHPTGGGGNGFWVGEFNGGQAVRYWGQYFFDGETDYWNLNSPNKFGVYDFENYDINGIGDSGKMFIFDDVVYAKVGHYLLVKNLAMAQKTNKERHISAAQYC